jgi:predicted AAA+ superfamily ATPase
LNRLRNAELFLKENEGRLVVIDEVQRQPELFPLIRALVDQNRAPGRFLILGSASPELLRQSSETLAGRISYLELTPFHYNELPNKDVLPHWVRGGFPPALFAADATATNQWLQDFIITFIERDLPQFGLNAPSQTLRTLLQMLTGVHANLLNFSNLGNSLGLTVPTVKRYMAYLENAYFTRYLFPWFANVSKRIVKTPKFYFRDTGVLHYLAGIPDTNHLLANQLAGASWEGYVLQQVIANLPQNVLPFFYRTKDGAEIDLLLVKGTQPVMAVEVKMSANPSLGKSARIAHEDVGRPPLFIVTPHPGDYPLDEQVRVCDLPFLLSKLPV